MKATDVQIIPFPLETGLIKNARGKGTREKFDAVDARLRRIDQAIKSLTAVRATTMVVYMDLLDQLCR